MASREQEVALTKAREKKGVAEFRLAATKDEAAAITSKGKGAAEVIEFKNQAEAAGWKKSVEAFDGSGSQYAQYVLYQKIASAYRNIMVNTADSPIMKIFESFNGPSGKVPTKTKPAKAVFNGHRPPPTVNNGFALLCRKCGWQGQSYQARVEVGSREGTAFLLLRKTRSTSDGPVPPGPSLDFRFRQSRPMQLSFCQHTAAALTPPPIVESGAIMSQSSTARGPVAGLITLAVIACIGWEIFEFVVNRKYVEVGQSLLLQYKGPILFGSRNYPKDGRLADMTKGEIGVIEQMPGPGRHFYCPIWWERTIVKDEIVLPGEVAVVTSLVGKDL